MEDDLGGTRQPCARKIMQISIFFAPQHDDPGRMRASCQCGSAGFAFLLKSKGEGSRATTLRSSVALAVAAPMAAELVSALALLNWALVEACPMSNRQGCMSKTRRTA